MSGFCPAAASPTDGVAVWVSRRGRDVAPSFGWFISGNDSGVEGSHSDVAVVRPPWQVRVVLSHAWVRLGLLYAAMAGSLSALQPALYGRLRPLDDYTVAVFGPMFAGVAIYLTERGYWKLTQRERWVLRAVMVTAVPSGDARIDELALLRLRNSANKDSRSTRVSMVLLGVCGVAASVTAALRVSLWWLLPLVPTLSLGALVLVQPRAASTRYERAEQLDTVLHPKEQTSR